MRLRQKVTWVVCALLVLCMATPQSITIADDQSNGYLQAQPFTDEVPSTLAEHAPPPWAKAWMRGEHSQYELREGLPMQVQMRPEPVAEIDEVIKSGMTEGKFPGAVAMVIKEGRIVKHESYGHAVKYQNGHELQPDDQQIETQKDTIYDIASMTKMFTTIAVMQLVEKGEVDLVTSASEYLPELNDEAKRDITVRQMLTHTSGLPAWLPLYTYSDDEERLQVIYDTPLANEPGTTYAYSDLGLILLGQLVERVSGSTLDQYIAKHITEPLGMEDTMFNPPAEWQHRIAATEYQPYIDRGMVQGSVHDENAYSFGGVAGHAGLFSTAHDLAILSQAILNGGVYQGNRILEKSTVVDMLTNQITNEANLAQGLGWQLNRSWFMGELASPSTTGHTGFAGTSFVLDPERETIVILLTNRVHPTRDTGSINPWRQGLANKVAEAIDEHPKQRRANP
ncbi:serine hydrolase domain-containing protein [Caldalkalibacillus salinus]|uniref:serine hydrolase domain-containing protein n=1 Tax=Caldalkalibacillus salinus TaxID=2803787 RepID=UPI0019220C16|nr:serine hydrolase [Caldalkalibacillus salinus]